MAQFYTGPHFWTDQAWEVTAHSKPGQYANRKEFIEAVNSWMDRHNIKSKWSGESSLTHNGVETFNYHVRIVEAEHRTLFALRWA